MITKIEATDGFRGVFFFIPSRTKVEADGTRTSYPGMKVEWEIDNNGDRIFDIYKAADKQVEMLVNQALLAFDEEVMKQQKERIVELFGKALPRWRAFQEGLVREYVPIEEKKAQRAQALLDEVDPEILRMASEMQGEGVKGENPLI